MVSLIYYPNECFICKSLHCLKRCSRCQMISYCKREHQLQHWETHKQICTVISSILAERNVSHIFENCRGFSAENWRNAKEEACQEVKARLKRSLTQDEEQMFYFPRVCFTCHDARQESLKNCPNCPNSSFCPEHPSSSIHDQDCPQIRESHDLDYLYLQEKDTAHASLFTLAMSFVVTTPMVKSKCEKLPKNLQEFLQFAQVPKDLSTIESLYLKEFLTLPLVAFSALEKLKLLSLSKLVIHTSNASQNFEASRSWELLFHLMPNLTQLKIIMVCEEDARKKRCILCDKCRKSKRKLFIQSIKETYVNYVSMQDYEEPGLVLLMNQNPPSVDDEVFMKMWKMMLMTWGIVNCPLVMFTFTEERARIARDSIESTFSKVQISYLGQNEFIPEKTKRFWENERVFRDNEQMLIFKISHEKGTLTCDRCGIMARTVDLKSLKCAGCEVDLLSTDAALFPKRNENRHRDLYYVDCCQVCHFRPNLAEKFQPLIACKFCQLISYCNKSHQLQDWPHHKTLCKVIFNMLQESGCETLYKQGKKDDCVWIKARIDLMLQVQKRLSRDLLDHEKQIFLFPSACFMCHDTNPNNLTTCLDCRLKLCTNHQECREHLEVCANVLSAFKCESQLLTVKRSPSPITIVEAFTYSSRKKLLNSIPSTDLQHFPISMPMFIKDHINLKDQKDWQDSHPQYLSNLRQIMYADVFSRPMTLLFAMKHFNWSLQSNLVHVIGATDDEVCEAAYWEIVLHFLPNVKHLKIVFIGPQISELKTVQIDVCNNCRDKSLQIVCVPMRYDFYFRSESFEKPDIIAGFNLQMYESDLRLNDDNWEETILTLTRVEAPFLLTENTIDKAELDNRKLKAILGKWVRSAGFIVNYFMGLSLERDYLTERFQRINQYLIVYDELYGLKIEYIDEPLKINDLKL